MLSYNAGKQTMSVHLSVDEGVARWRYRNGFDEWSHEMPVKTFYPYPLQSVDRGRYLKGILILVAGPIAVGYVLLGFERSVYTAAGSAIVCFLYLALQFAPWIHGPIRWATFDTEIPTRTVYIFQGSNGSHFDEFVSSFNQEIVTARLAESAKPVDPG
ncbi:hypothetical protein Poly51_30680 [Rubripirellula tenax]|uniref:Uncharacterized protein n=1 Tax=Rubripirellula tenax TaxID=2528015 RepID=A0A5C6F4G5_9BACT|nr:hypothetical protein [Rubripirellula tenax]TWU54351.1 hypothetical protein Poly51_30680 [Rubripirellula tenax]